MRRIVCVLIAVAALAGVVAYMAPASGQSDGEAAPIFGIKIPPGYRDWRLISVAHEEGNLNDLRAILGNDVAIKAFREGKLPLPDGTILRPVGGKRKGLRPSPIFRGRVTQERGSVHGQGLKKIRLDRASPRRRVCRRQNERTPSRRQHLLFLPRDLKVERGEP
jgi:Cytochrome P460